MCLSVTDRWTEDSHAMEDEKSYDPEDRTLKFVERQDDIGTLDEDPSVLKAEMSCGHAVTPESLTGWCRSLLDQGQFRFLCPSYITETAEMCGAEWPYPEVRRLAVLTTEEMEHFEKTMADSAAATYCEYKSCPGCNTYVERKDLSNLCVMCTVCTADNGQVYEFCWQCMKKWKGPQERSDHCDNDGCINQDLELLKNCKTTTLTEVQGVSDCPSIRACPTCGQRVEHDKTGCKNILCPRCNVEFCFVCLKLTSDCLETSSYFIACSDGVAPRQTSIPVWCRN
uniref:RING-type domain-containing protein n=1 Tax=Esox lucius TaxID=8010 RepID=A0A6Q2XLY9_ESOLU